MWQHAHSLQGERRSPNELLPLVAQSDSLALGVEGSAPFMGIQHSGGNGARVSVVVQGGSR